MSDKPLILIVDDEHANQFLLDGLLSVHGYQTKIASNGEECLEILHLINPDLILLDIMMPKMTGIEVLDKIIENDRWKNIPVIMVSAKIGGSDVMHALEKGAIDYIKKPFDELELLARVKVGIRLKQNEDHLKELVMQRDDFVRTISHDLRSPFTAIYGLAEILMSDENVTKDQKESLGFILDSVEFSLEYFNKLLNWARLENNDLPLKLTEVSLKELFDMVFLLFENKSITNSIHLENLIEPSIKIKVDVTFFRQVIGNLVGNAMKFTRKEGKITGWCQSIASGLEIIVTDNGIGMPEELSLETLFTNPILKSRQGTNGEKGTGIGLGICKKILDAHKFGFTFRRRAEGGTDFVINLSEKNIIAL
jgi:two-component system, sensor histidine kinase and response regulator